jgi:hypothetical protein
MTLPLPIAKHIIEYYEPDKRALQNASRVCRSWHEFACEVYAVKTWERLAIVSTYSGVWRDLVRDRNKKNTPQVSF